MYIDINGKKRQKVGLHIHTTLSDGAWSPEKVKESYRSQGYDAIALTDHWKYGESGEDCGMTIISGAEYNIGGNSTEQGVFHVVGLFMEKEPTLDKNGSAQEIIDGIHEVGGLAVLAHPAWSLNTPEMIKALSGIDATEIYNAVSECGFSRRADSSLIVDMLGMDGYFYPLLATDDCHYYSEGDCCNAYVMVECDSLDRAQMINAIKQGRFYATQGPEIHLKREGNVIKLNCTPCVTINFSSNVTWAPDRAVKGEGLTHAEYVIKDCEKWIRAEVTDQYGNCAWSNIIKI
jgi:hypothetical protein